METIHNSNTKLRVKSEVSFKSKVDQDLLKFEW